MVMRDSVDVRIVTSKEPTTKKHKSKVAISPLSLSSFQLVKS